MQSESVRPTNQEHTKSGERFDNIDLLRALAIMSVVLFHFTARFPADLTLYRHALPSFDYGNLGVELFFIISGYCIWMTISRSHGLIDFLAKRFGRIQPAFTAAVLLTFAVVTLFGLPGRQVSIAAMLGNLSWLTCFYNIHLVDGAYWSLITELKFYVLFGTIFFALKKWVKPFDAWLTLSIAGAVLFLFSRLFLQSSTGEMIATQILLFPYAPFFLVGMAICDSASLGVYRKIACAAALALAAFQGGFDPIAAAILIALVPLTALVLARRSMRIPVWLRFIGLISYPLYLIHQNIGLVILRQMASVIESDALRCATTMVILVLLASLISILFEHRYRPLFESLIREPWRFLSRCLSTLRRSGRSPTQAVCLDQLRD